MSVSSEDAAAAATEESKRMAVQPPESQSLPLCFLWLLTFFKGQACSVGLLLKGDEWQLKLQKTLWTGALPDGCAAFQTRSLSGAAALQA